MTTQLSQLAVQHFVDNNGNALAGGQLYTYQAGTSTPAATYTDSTGVTPNTNPVILNARGEANVWVSPSQAYKFVLYDSLNNLIWSVDNISDGSLNSALGAALANTTDMTKGVALVGGAVRVVSSIATLRTLPKTGSPEAFVTGYYAQGDGGGGAYWYNFADTTSADNGGTIIVANDGGRWYLVYNGSVSVDQFGAIGNGTNNDSAAFNAAIAAVKGTITLNPAKTYAVNLVLTGRGIRINGQVVDNLSLAGTPIKSLVPYNHSSPCIQIGNSTTMAGGITLENLTIWSAAADGSPGTVGLSLVGAEGCNFNNIGIGSSFSQNNLLLQSGSQPVTYNYFSGVQLWMLANVNTTGVLGAYYGTSFTTANYFVNCNITGPSGTGTGFAVDIGGVTLQMVNTWIQVTNNAGVRLNNYGANYPIIQGCGVTIDSNSSSDVQVTSIVSADTNVYPISFFDGQISVSGKFKNYLGSTVSLPGDWWLKYQPTLTWPIVQGSLQSYNPTSGNTSSVLNVGGSTDFTVVFGGSGGVYLSPGGVSTFFAGTSYFAPQTDNARSLGISSQRWTTVFATTGTINTSDGTTKQDVAVLSAAENRVAQRIKTLVKTFRYVDAVKVKGADKARRHVGLIAQDVLQAFKDEGLDATEYGLFCSDTWWEYNGEPVQADGDGNAELVTFELDGKTYREHDAHPEAAVRNVENVKAQSVTRLGLRYDEVFAFMLAAL